MAAEDSAAAVHGGRVYEYALASGREWQDVLDFSANINPLGPPESVLQAIVEALPQIRHYPDAHHTQVRAVLAKRYQVPPDSLVCGNGASEVLELAVRQLQPCRVWVCEPAFAEYALAAQRLRVPVARVAIHWTERGTELPWDELDRVVRPGDAVILNNPHNPTGGCWPLMSWWPVLERWLATGVGVVVDESFADFLPDEYEFSLLASPVLHPRLWVVRSATKMYALPGLRFGFAVTHPQTAAAVAAVRDPWSVNQLAQVAAAAAYQDHAFVTQTRIWLQAEHAWAAQTWGNWKKVQWYPPSVNFFLIRLRDASDAERLQAGLASHGVFVRSCHNFHGLDSSYLRIALKAHADNERLWQLAHSLLTNGSPLSNASL
ncbi:MAG: threonine-phosphate decarboxylase CobD [Alicyclobacillus sp.]|nr:threonine-phosphate decarboxylase CobD [Alicyclobacillus sp.]